MHLSIQFQADNEAQSKCIGNVIHRSYHTKHTRLKLTLRSRELSKRLQSFPGFLTTNRKRVENLSNQCKNAAVFNKWQHQHGNHKQWHQHVAFLSFSSRFAEPAVRLIDTWCDTYLCVCMCVCVCVWVCIPLVWFDRYITSRQNNKQNN